MQPSKDDVIARQAVYSPGILSVYDLVVFRRIESLHLEMSFLKN